MPRRSSISDPLLELRGMLVDPVAGSDLWRDRIDVDVEVQVDDVLESNAHSIQGIDSLLREPLADPIVSSEDDPIPTLEQGFRIL